MLVAPGGSHLRIGSRRVVLAADEPVGGLRPRADLTLIDLVASYGSGVLAVVLTGMGDDGLDGCRAVVAAGGQVVAQDGESSAVDGMPRRVREADLATLTGDPDVLGRAVARAAGVDVPRSAGLAADPGSASDRPGGAPAVAWRRGDDPVRPPVAGPPGSGAVADDLLDAVRAVLVATDDVHLDHLRATYLSRRLVSFARRHGLRVDDALPGQLRDDPGLRHQLVARLHVHVTSFFRDAEHWAALDASVLDGLPAHPRVWSAGCADGSEAYSLAIACMERGRRPLVWATDVDDEVLARCRAASYRDEDVRDIPESVRRRYFRESRRGGITVRADVAALVTTAQHDALRDPLPPEPFDLVACRNLVIYLGVDGRERLYGRLAAAVRPGGVLFTGAADAFHDAGRFGFESIGGTLFRRVAG